MLATPVNQMDGAFADGSLFSNSGTVPMMGDSAMALDSTAGGAKVHAACDECRMLSSSHRRAEHLRLTRLQGSAN